VQRFLGVTLFVVMTLTIDCNNFFLKYVLWVPADHDLLKFRVALLGLCALAVSKEWYEFLSNKFCHRLGPFAWLMFYNCGVEVLLVIKCSEGKFTEPFPWYVKAIWTCLTAGFLLLLSIAYSNQ